MGREGWVKIGIEGRGPIEQDICLRHPFSFNGCTIIFLSREVAGTDWLGAYPAARHPASLIGLPSLDSFGTYQLHCPPHFAISLVPLPSRRGPSDRLRLPVREQEGFPVLLSVWEKTMCQPPALQLRQNLARRTVLYVPDVDSHMYGLSCVPGFTHVAHATLVTFVTLVTTVAILFAYMEAIIRRHSQC
ncbi:hypothetical protein VTI28DRAFT_9878 [Corynascus sepedonium]